jgi:hypothetical protein
MVARRSTSRKLHPHRMTSEKTCRICKLTKSLVEFKNCKGCSDGKTNTCKLCLANQKRHWVHRNWGRIISVRRARRELTRSSPRSIQASLYYNAKRRAKEEGIPFNLERSDIVVPPVCPILGLVLKPSSGTVSDASPTLDRIYPDKGYVKGNVVVISMRANRLKSNASIDEIRKLASFYDQFVA